ncbi:hypothetical protein DNU48_22530 [Salmonella enterica subsp. enterica serovar Agona]|nr:hypothetical protein [Salmonella enterica subsp. enterica serovar Agona]EBW7525071.1 hypothetical protein [Salmonella enterica subsp. enterica serovar Agona]
MEKLLGDTKKFGRCKVPGHGCKCCVSKDIQSIPVCRTTEKRKVMKREFQELFTRNIINLKE